MINKKLIHFATKANFNARKAEIPDTSIAFIKDTQEIYTHGQLYNCGINPETTGWYSLVPYIYDSTNKDRYYSHKLYDLSKEVDSILRIRATDDINSPSYSEWILRVNHTGTYSKNVTLTPTAANTHSLKVYVDSSWGVWVQCSLLWTCQLQYKLEQGTLPTNVTKVIGVPTGPIQTIVNCGRIKDGAAARAPRLQATSENSMNLASRGRLATANIATASDSTMYTMMSTTAMTSGRPTKGDGHIINFNWDTTENQGAQLFIPTSKNSSLQFRVQGGSAWSANANYQQWATVLDTNNYTSILEGKYVTQDTAQIITGAKTFGTSINISKIDLGVGYKQDDVILLRFNGKTTNDTILSANGGKICFRPNGTSAPGGQTTIDTDGNLTAIKFVKLGGTSSQFLKADGSVDSNSYLTAITKAMVESVLTGSITSHTHSSLRGIVSTGLTAQGGDYGMYFYATITKDTEGLFPASNNANSIIAINRHPGNFYSQLGFNSTGRIYYRAFNAQPINTELAWSSIAFTSDLNDYLKKTDATTLYQPKGNYLTAITKAMVENVLTGNITSHTHSQYLTQHQSLTGYLKTDCSNISVYGANNFLNILPAGGGLPTDNMTFITSPPNNDDSSNPSFWRRSALSVWNYIKSKADSVYLQNSNVTYINSLDTRDSTTLPNTYDQGLRINFKNNATNGLNDGGIFNGELHIKPYGTKDDLTGMKIHQLGFTSNGNIWHRSNTNATTWSNWRKLLDSENYTSLLDGKYVTLDTEQTISAVKTISAWAIKVLRPNMTRTLYNSPTGSDYIIFADCEADTYIRGKSVGFQTKAGTTDVQIKNDGIVQAKKFVRTGGTATHILMADGSLKNFYPASSITAASSDDGVITPLGMNNWVTANFIKKTDAVNAVTLSGYAESKFFREDLPAIQEANILKMDASRSGSHQVFHSGWHGSVFKFHVTASNSGLAFYRPGGSNSMPKLLLNLDSKSEWTDCGTLITSTKGYFTNRVGIGTSAPEKDLHVEGTTKITGSLDVYSGIELYGTVPFIDFHAKNGTSDYSARLGEYDAGVITCEGDFICTGIVAAKA